MTEWLDAANEKREILKNRQPLLFQRVVEILFEHDPVNINCEVNPDEYEPEAGTIIPRLADCSGPIEARKIIHEEFIRWLYDGIGEEDEYTNIAKDIWNAWMEFN